ncbi:hypothetical protein SALBM311S_01112 [Streptomyces alboniger]
MHGRMGPARFTAQALLSHHVRPQPTPPTRVVLILVALLAALVPPLGAANPAAAVEADTSAGSNVELVNPFIGTTGSSSTEYGGMIPSTAPPFGMTRWSPMTRENYVSRLPYHLGDPKITGFIGTHQPAIWMGDSGYVVGMPGVGAVKTTATDRGLPYRHSDETAAPSSTPAGALPPADGTDAPGPARPGTSGFGVAGRLTPQGTAANYVVQATRSGVTGAVHIDPARREISGYNPDRQDSNLGPFKAPGFKGYFVARFDTPFAGYGTATGATQYDQQSDRTDQDVAGLCAVPGRLRERHRTDRDPFISVDQARANLDKEVPDRQTFDATVARTRAAWLTTAGGARRGGGGGGGGVGGGGGGGGGGEGPAGNNQHQRAQPPHPLPVRLLRPDRGGPSNWYGRSPTPTTTTPPTDSPATRTPARCRPGTCSPPWASTQ